MMGIEKYAEINKFFNYKLFYDFIVEKHPKFKRFAEVGVWKGHSIVYLARLLRDRPNVKLFAIDLFDDLWKHKDNAEKYKGFHIERLKEMYDHNLKIANVRDMIEDYKGISYEVADQFKDKYFDFVFIDGDHEYESVKRDIEAYMPKIKKGGIIAGHDHAKSQQGVIKALVELLPNHKHSHGYTWYQEI